MASLAGIGLLAVVINLVDGVAGTVSAGSSPAVGPRVQSLFNVGVSALDRGLEPDEALAAMTTGIRISQLPRIDRRSDADALGPWSALEDLGVTPAARVASDARRVTLVAPAARLAVALYASKADAGGLLGVAVELATADAPVLRGFRRPKVCMQALLEQNHVGEVVGGRLQVLLPHDGGPIEPPGPDGNYFEGDELAWNATRWEAKRWVWHPQEIAEKGGCGHVLAKAGKAREARAPDPAALKELVRAANEALEAAAR